MQKEFLNVFGGNDRGIRTFFAPGRVNLIGEHIDYNGGHVLPCALEIGTYVLAREREDECIRFYSNNFQESGIIEVTDLTYHVDHGWTNYPKGVFRELLGKIKGFDLYFDGTIPNGAGLSSSASIELVTAVLVNSWFGLGKSPLELVQLSQRVENEYIGVNCGIMDQFAVGFGKPNHAILLDCETLEYSYLPLELGQTSIVIANSNKKRGLAESAYNDRRSTCDRALEKLQSVLDVEALAHILPHQLEEHKSLLTEEEWKRARHVVTEEDRTRKASEALKEKDLFSFGALMKASHLSLRHDYEVTGQELDTLVEAAWKQEGCVGARMTGAGFGGCTVNLVRDDSVKEFIRNVEREYLQKVGYLPSFYTVKVGGGARELIEA